MSIREALRGPGGTIAAVILVVVAIAAILVSVKSSFRGNPTPERWFVDASTGQPFQVELKVGMTIPVKAPSGGDGYPAELCYWTADGGTKSVPTKVLLNSWIGKPGPTFCPDCHRLVVEHNPAPGPGVEPPPTEAEYMAGARVRSRDDR